MYISRNGLRERHSYGYYRFFAFEFILLLILSNVGYWFEDPFSPLQLASWIFLAGSLYLVFSGFSILGVTRAAGKSSSVELVEKGIYGRIRHPLYSSLMFLALGAFLKKPALYSAILMFGAGYTLISTIRAEEEVDAKKFGTRYEEYRKRTRMLVPYLF